MTDEDANIDEVVEAVAPAEPVVEPASAVETEAPATEPEVPAVVADPEPTPELSAAPVVREQDRAYFRQWLREDARWIADELWLHQTSVPMEDRPLRNP